MPLFSQLAANARGALQLLRLRPFDEGTPEGRSLERYRRIALSSAASIAGRVAQTGIGLLSVPLLVGYFGKERYGLWATIAALVPWTALFDLGLVNAIVNPVAEAHGLGDRTASCASVSTAFALLLGIAGALGLALLVAGPAVNWSTVFETSISEDALAPAVAVALAISVAALPLGLLPQLFVGYQKAYAASAFQTAGAALSFALLFIAVRLRLSFAAVVGAASSAALLGGALALWYLLASEMRWTAPRWSLVSRRALRRLLATSVPLYLFQIGALLVSQSQQLVLARRTGLETVAEYDLLLKLYYLTVGLTVLSTSSFAPSFRESFERAELGWMRRGFRRMIAIRMSIAVAASVTIVALGNWVLRLWLGRADFGHPVTVWLALAALVLVATWASSYLELLMVLDRIWPQVTLVLVQGVLTVALTWALAPRFGVIGALVGMAGPATLTAILAAADRSSGPRPSPRVSRLNAVRRKSSHHLPRSRRTRRAARSRTSARRVTLIAPERARCVPAVRADSRRSSSSNTAPARTRALSRSMSLAARPPIRSRSSRSARNARSACTASPRSGSAQTCPSRPTSPAYAPWDERTGTSRDGIGMELSSVMKSMFPDQPVATTGRPSVIASIRWSPSPSERWRDSITSQLAYKARSSSYGRLASTIWMRGHPRSGQPARAYRRGASRRSATASS